MDFIKYANNVKQEMINDLCELLKIDTVLVEQPEVKEAPFGYNMVKALNYMLDLGKKMGFNVKNIDNVCGHIEYGEGDEIIGVLAHLDVVPTGDGWMYPPFEPTIVGDKIYARGALDDKGACIASLYALKALKDNNIKLNKKHKNFVFFCFLFEFIVKLNQVLRFCLFLILILRILILCRKTYFLNIDI